MDIYLIKVFGSCRGKRLINISASEIKIQKSATATDPANQNEIVHIADENRSITTFIQRSFVQHFFDIMIFHSHFCELKND